MAGFMTKGNVRHFWKAKIRAKTEDVFLFSYIFIEPLITSSVYIFNISNHDLFCQNTLHVYTYILRTKTKNLKGWIPPEGKTVNVSQTHLGSRDTKYHLEFCRCNRRSSQLPDHKLSGLVSQHWSSSPWDI